MLAPDTYSLVNYSEAENVVADFKTIADRAEEIYQQLPADRRDAFYELVLFPTKASALLNELYLAAGKNALYARQGRASANDYAAETRQLFQADTNLMAYFNHTFAGGKWDHFMDQTHLGYTSWNDPPHNSLRAIKLTEIEVPEAAAMGVAVEGSESAWPGATNEAMLPSFDVFNQQRHYIDVFNKGKTPFEFTATASEPWIVLKRNRPARLKKTNACGSVWIGARCRKAWRAARSKSPARRNEVIVKINAFNPAGTDARFPARFCGRRRFCFHRTGTFHQKNGRGSKSLDKNSGLRPHAFRHAGDAAGGRAQRDAGKGFAVPGISNVSVQHRRSGSGHHHLADLEFRARSRACALPFHLTMKPPQIVTLVPADYKAQNGNRDWEKVVGDNARYARTTHTLAQPGYHTLKFWMVDPGVVLQKIVVDSGGVKPSYLGPPESFHRN